MADEKTKRPKLEKGMSPKGIAHFPYLNVPDEYKGKKSFKTGLTVAAEFATPLVEKLTEMTEALRLETVAKLTDETKNGKDGKAKAAAKKALADLGVNLPFEDVVDNEGEPTGDIRFKFGSNADYEDAKTKKIIARKLPLFDSANKETKVAIWGGSVIKVAFDFAPYYMPSTNKCGVKLRMTAVQVITPNTGGNKDYGFGEEEGGFRDDGADDAPKGFSDESGAPPTGGEAGGDDEF